MNNRHSFDKYNESDLDTENQEHYTFTRSVSTNFLEYSSNAPMFTGLFSAKRPQINLNQTISKTNSLLKMQKKRKIWEQYSPRVTTTSNMRSPKFTQKSNKIIIKDKLINSLLPNQQNITSKMLSILEERVKKLEDAKIEPIFLETTIKMSTDDLKQLFSNTFRQQRQATIQKLDLILKCFAVHRLDIGQRKSISIFASLLFGILSQNILLTFTQLCHMTLSSCFLSFILQQKSITDKICREIILRVQDVSMTLYVFLSSKWQISTGEYFTQWIGSLFTCLQLEGMNTKLDRYYYDDEDQFIIKVMNYLFSNKFSKHSLIHTSVCLMKSLQKQILRQEKKQIVVNILRKPRAFLDETMFLRDLFS